MQNINGFEVDKYNILGIKEGATTSTCPECSHNRKKSTDKCMSVFWDTGLGQCNHCGARVQLHTYKAKQGYKNYITPVEVVKSEISQKVLGYFKDHRGISEGTLNHLRISDGKEWMPKAKKEIDVIEFNYYLHGKLVNTKYRGANKDFRFIKDAKIIPYNIDSIIGSNIAYIVEGECFTGDTEVLTENGWIKFSSYNGEKLTQVNRDFTSELVSPIGLIKKDYNGDLVKLSMRGYSSLTTEGHNLVLLKEGELIKRKAKDVFDKIRNEFIPRVSYTKNNGISLTDNQIRLQVAFSADFTFRKGGDIYGAFQKQRKIDRIIKLLDEEGLRYAVFVEKSGRTGVFVNRGQNTEFYTKLYNNNWLTKLSLEQCKVIIDEVLYWDGNSVPNREQIEYSSKEIHNATFIQTVAHLCGFMSTVIPRSNSLGKWFKCSILFNKKHNTTQIGLKRELIPYNGTVYCASVPSGMLLVRYENKISVSGNCDVAAVIESGIYTVISVPNGFTLPKKDGTSTVNLEYLDDFIDLFDKCETIVLATDNDEAGRNGRDELIRRLGADKCYLVNFSDCKDANEYLLKYGKINLKETLLNYSPIPLTNVETIYNTREQLFDMWQNGMRRGYTVGLREMDKNCSFVNSQYTLLLASPSSGKSDKIDDICIRLNLRYGMKAAFASKETSSLFHHNKWVRRILGRKPTADDFNKQDLLDVIDFINENYFSVVDTGDLKSTLDKFRELYKRFGVKLFVLDPFNRTRLKEANRGDVNEYTEQYHHELDKFVKETDSHLFLVLHPTKMVKKQGSKFTIEMPSAYNAKGGGEHYDMSYNIIGMVRDYDRNVVVFNTLKWKFDHLGTTGVEWEEAWNINNGRYTNLKEGFEPNDGGFLDAEWDNHCWIERDISEEQQETPPPPIQDIISLFEAEGVPKTVELNKIEF